MNKFLTAILLVLACSVAHGKGVRKPPSNFEVLTLVAWHEARGEPLHVQKLVVAVVKKRAIMSNKSVYEIVKEPHQFPWQKRITTWRLTQEQAEFGFLVMSKPDVVTNYVYFNQNPHTFTKKNVKIGGLYFAVK